MFSTILFGPHQSKIIVEYLHVNINRSYIFNNDYKNVVAMLTCKYFTLMRIK